MTATMTMAAKDGEGNKDDNHHDDHDDHDEDDDDDNDDDDDKNIIYKICIDIQTWQLQT